MNNRYQPAHTWAALLLGGGGFSDLLAEGPQQAESLLVNMNRLWEAVIRWLAAEAATILGGSAVHSTGDRSIVVREQDRATRSFQPDVLLRLRPDDQSHLPVDAKYKRYDQHAVAPDDIHQLLTYAHSYRSSGQIPRALIVHPAELGSVHRSITVRASRHYRRRRPRRASITPTERPGPDQCTRRRALMHRWRTRSRQAEVMPRRRVQRRVSRRRITPLASGAAHTPSRSTGCHTSQSMQDRRDLIPEASCL